MQNRDDTGNGGWKSFRPSKTLWFWSSLGVFLATMIVGFSWGGWVTGGTAEQMAQEARADGRAELVAEVCVERYRNTAGFTERLTKFKEESSWDQEEIIVSGDWTTLPGIEEPIDNAADLCADKLARMETPADATAKDTTTETEPTG